MQLSKRLQWIYGLIIFLLASPVWASRNGNCPAAYATGGGGRELVQALGNVEPISASGITAITDYTRRFLRVMSMDDEIQKKMGESTGRELHFADLNPDTIEHRFADGSVLLRDGEQIFWARGPTAGTTALLEASHLNNDPPNEAFRFRHHGTEKIGESPLREINGATIVHADWYLPLGELLETIADASRYWEFEHSHIFNEVGFYDAQNREVLAFHQMLGAADLEMGANLSRALEAPFMMTAVVPSGIRYSAFFVNGENVTADLEKYLPEAVKLK